MAMPANWRHAIGILPLYGTLPAAASMCLPGSAITLKDGVVTQSNFGDFSVARITNMPEFDVHIVPSADPPTGMGEPGLPPLAPAFANAVARLRNICKTGPRLA